MARALNKASSTLDGIAPGGVGEVDETPGVLALVRAGALELQGTTVDAFAKRVDKRRGEAVPAPTLADMRAAEQRIRDLEQLVDTLRKTITDLEAAASAKASNPAAKTEG